MFQVVEIKDCNNIMDFQAWAGGKDTLDEAKAKGLEDELQELFENTFNLEEPINEDDLNNWLWFDEEPNDLVYGE